MAQLLSTSQSDILLQLLISQIKTTPLYNPNLDLTQVKMMIAGINPLILAQLSQMVGLYSPLGSMIGLIVDNVQQMMKNPELSITEIPSFLENLKEMYLAVSCLKNVKISTSDLVDVTTDIINIVLCMTVSDETKLKNLTAFIKASSLLVKFELPVQSAIFCCFN